MNEYSRIGHAKFVVICAPTGSSCNKVTDVCIIWHKINDCLLHYSNTPLKLQMLQKLFLKICLLLSFSYYDLK